MTAAVDRGVDIVGRTLFGEVRGEPIMEQLAVATVIRERALRPGWWGEGWEGVCRAPYQFSCWNPHDPNYKKVLHAEAVNPKAFKRCVSIAELAVRHMTDEDVFQFWQINMPSCVPTHYYKRSSGKPKNWGLCCELPTYWLPVHNFLKGIKGSPRRADPP